MFFLFYGCFNPLALKKVQFRRLKNPHIYLYYKVIHSLDSYSKFHLLRYYKLDY